MNTINNADCGFKTTICQYVTGDFDVSCNDFQIGCLNRWQQRFSFAGAAIYGALYNVPHVHHRFKLWIVFWVLSVGCFIGMKKEYDSWNERDNGKVYSEN